jgi:DNA-binding MarR family transcriptional regulator
MRLSSRLLPFTLFNSREVSCTTLTIFLIVGEHSPEGILQADIPKFINISTSSVSRNCCLLGNKTQKNANGMGLIHRERHHSNQTLMHLSLTENGKALYEKLTANL